MKLEHTVTPCTKISSEWLKDVIRQDTIKLLEGNIGKAFSDINLTNIFSGQSPKATEIKAKINQWDLITLTSFCTAKETKKKTKPQLTEWEKIVSNDAMDKGFISKVCNLQLLHLQNIQATYTTQQQKSQPPNGKKGKRHEKTFFQGRYTDDQQTHEEMLNIVDYKRNANQNYHEIPPHTSQNGHHL